MDNYLKPFSDMHWTLAVFDNTNIWVSYWRQRLPDPNTVAQNDQNKVLYKYSRKLKSAAGAGSICCEQNNDTSAAAHSAHSAGAVLKTKTLFR